MFKYYILTFFIFISVGLWAQPISVTGVVVDDAGEEVIGATVVVKGNEQHGTITDIDGKFSLQVPDLQVTLVFSYVGMKSVELKATSQMRVVLSSDAKELEEVVVTGILKMDKRLFTGATDKLDAEKTKIDGITDISRALEVALQVFLCKMFPALSEQPQNPGTGRLHLW